jgi:hypothetical protein
LGVSMGVMTPSQKHLLLWNHQRTMETSTGWLIVSN